LSGGGSNLVKKEGEATERGRWKSGDQTTKVVKMREYGRPSAIRVWGTGGRVDKIKCPNESLK